MAPPIMTVTVRYAKPGAQPPIYLAGSFSDPAWQPQEMEYTAIADNEYEYRKDVQVEHGKEYQYKFRMGTGDWWILNEDAPTVTDDIGNRNNLLTAPAIEKSAAQPEQPHLSDTNATPAIPANDMATEENMEHQVHQKIDDANESIDAKEVADTPEVKEMPSSPAVVVERAESDLQFSSDSKEQEAIKPEPGHLSAQEPHSDRAATSNGATTPDLADTAAEVAESAAVLDHNPPTPPISDDEAGRIGYRRMSNTPIPQVAKVAVEVADVAATLDNESVSNVEIPPRRSFMEDEDDDEEFDDTPWEERVPLFPHECPGPNDKVVASRLERVIPSPSKPATEEEDFNDPSLIPFPTDREGIYAQILNVERRMPADEVRLDGSPPSSAVGSGPNNPSPRILALEQSPSLDSITEEHEIDEQPLNHASGPSNPSSEVKDAVLSERGQDTTPAKSVDIPGIENQKSDKDAATEDHQVATAQKDLISKGAKNEENKPLELNVEPHAEHSGEEEDISPKTTTEVLTSNSVSKDLEGASQPGVATYDDRSTQVEAKDKDAKPTIIVEEVHSKGDIETPQPTTEESQSASKPLDKASILPQNILGPATPFIVGDKQLGHNNEQTRKISTSNTGPSITVQPATPRASLKLGRGDSSEATDAASSTAVATDNGSSGLKSRNQRVVSPSPDRPLTPTSIRSSHKDRNFLKAFWRVVFVDWIGGLIMKLCGGRRKT
ncbi:hypothetical protein G7Y89_g13487 [Cudoniella acicularis]|uniref:AMP-activated protein kinase glycogen-binding domain-containing protein n=1 Tax=Cudoniella acicularis TaxID=354080 RepID=A0A8H4R9R7_9HELO|nr:hypothetical protein G7Y89_g13487 [Cudoniella acicularis]